MRHTSLQGSCAFYNSGIGNGNFHGYNARVGNLYGDQYGSNTQQGGSGQSGNGVGAYGSPVTGNKQITNNNVGGDGDQYGTMNYNAIGDNGIHFVQNVPVTATYRGPGTGGGGCSGGCSGCNRCGC